MAYGGLNENMDAAAELGSNPVSKHEIQPELAGWRGTGLPNPSRKTKFSGANGESEVLVFPVQLTTIRIGNLARLIHTLLCNYHTHTYTVCSPSAYCSRAARGAFSRIRITTRALLYCRL